VSPPSSSSPPTSRTTTQITDACTTARGHQGEDDRFPAHVDAPAFEPRWNAQSLRAATGDAGLRARLGQTRLQVPLPSSTRARSGLATPCRR
jgi:hypothetical protein